MNQESSTIAPASGAPVNGKSASLMPMGGPVPLGPVSTFDLQVGAIGGVAQNGDSVA